MINKKIKMFILALMVLILTISAVNAADETTSDVTQDVMQIQHTETSSVTTQDNIETAKPDNNIEKTNKNIKKEGTTHIINNDTIDTFFVGEKYGLCDDVSEGDTLDFQGNIFKNHSIRFNKAVNVTTSTNDAVICLNTTSGSLLGDAPGNSFIIDINGSYSNFTGLYLNNTQFWVTNANHVNFYNMSMVVNDSKVGSGVGQTAIRDDSSYILLDNCFIYTRNNGGSSSFVITYCTYCTIQNSVIQGSGNVGNLLYLNTFNAQHTTTVGNAYNRLINNTVIGPETAAAICYCVGINGHDNEFINNTFNYAGNGITNAAGANYNPNNYFEGNVLNGGCGIAAVTNSTFINNTVNDNGLTTLAVNSTYSGNSFERVTYSSANVTFENNTVNGITTVNTPVNLSNNNLSAITLQSRASNSNLSNNNITDLVTVQATGVSIVDNDIDAQGDYAIVSTAANTVIANNTIRTTTKAGSDAINVPATATVTGNTPEAGSVYEVTDETYQNFFDSDGNLINTNVADYSTLTLVGTFNNKAFKFNNTRLNINGQNAVLKESAITLGENATVDMKEIAIENTNIDEEAIIVNGAKNKIRNLNITINSQNKAHAIVIKNDNNMVSSNNIKITAPSKDIDYSNNPAIADTAAIVVLSSDNTITSNNIEVTATESSTSGTIEAITLQGTDTNMIANNNVSSNVISVTGPAYVYGITSTVNLNKNTFDKNTIVLNSKSYAAGLQLMGAPIVSNVVGNNTINITATNDAYGIIVNGWDDNEIKSNTVSRNKVNATAKNVFLIEVASSSATPITSSFIQNNNLYGSGDYITAIAASGETFTISSNTINITGTSNETANTWDTIKPTTAGINIINAKSITALSNNINVTNGPAIKLDNVQDSTFNSSTINNDNTAIVLNNSNNNNLKANKVTTTSTYTTTLENSNSNTITGNTFNANNVLGGDDSVYCDESSTANTIESNTPIIKVLTQDTYDNFFDEESNLRDININILSLGSDLIGKDMIFNRGLNFTNQADYTIYNGTITVTGLNNTNIYFINLKINNTDKSAYTTDFKHSNQKNIGIYNNTIDVYGDDVTVIDVKAVNTGYSYLSVNNSNINVDAKNVKVIDYAGRDQNTSISGVCEMKYTNVTVKAQESAVVMDVVGGIPYMNSYNNIDISAYDAIALRANRTNLGYSSGFQRNNITINATKAKALVVDNKVGTSSDTVGYNNITITSSMGCAMELTKFNNTIIRENNIIVSGPYSVGIMFSNCTNDNITVNNITITGDSTSEVIGASEDIVLEITGVKVQDSSQKINVINNTIITSDVGGQDSTVSTNDQSVNVRNNKLKSSQLYGDDTVKTTQSGVTIENNIFGTITTTEDTSGLKNTEITLTATVTDEVEDKLNVGTVTFTDSSNNIIATVDVIDGVATTTQIFNQAIETTITATYNPPTNGLQTSSSQANLLIKNTLETIITIDELELKAGENTTITARVTDENQNNINTGKVVFKVNGKTLKDSAGKVIYAKVVDGIATVVYEVPMTMSGKTLNITAVYSGSSKNDKQIVTTEVSVDEVQPTLSITPFEEAVTTGSTITLKAKIAQADTSITNGKIVFKINGKTVKDDNGKVIYAKVDANGEVSVDYNIGNLKANEYTITAIFTAVGFDKIESNTTMTVINN